MELFHETTNILHVNTEPTRNYFIPFEKGSDVFAWRENSARFMLLNGEWDFHYYTDFRDLQIEMETSGVENLSTPDKISVPGNWQLQGFDHPDYVNTRYPIPYDPPFVPDENPCGVYHRSFEISLKDEPKKETEFFLNFEGVDSCFYLYINNTFAGYSQVSHMTHEFNITPLLKDGKNEMTVIVLKWCDGTYLECQDKWRMSGIFRDVFILERSVNRIRNYKVETENDGIVKVHLEFEGEISGKVTAVISDIEGNEVCKAETSEKDFELKIANPVLWNAENPYLYKLVLTYGNESIGEKIGFRKVEIKNGAVCVNGVPVKIKGTNRHESHPETGFYVPLDFARMELSLMKEHNINAIRTSHYPPSPWVLQLCDEMGFYVIDEADNEAHGSVEASHTTDNNGDYSGICLLANEPGYDKEILDRVQMMVARDVNRPCVIFWSLGNESGYAKSFENAARWVKKNDSSRLVHYESVHRMDCFPEPEDSPETLDVVSRMYSSPAWIENDFLKNENEKRPFLMCEYCHAMGNGPGDLEDYWQVFYKSDSLCGGLVWEWCDHGLKIGEDENGNPKYAYGGDFHEKIHDGNFVMDGLVYPDRRPHTGLKEVKNVYRPVRCEIVDLKKGIFRFTNTMDFSKLSEKLKVVYELTENGRKIKSEKLDFDVPPKESLDVNISELSSEVIKKITSGGEIFVRFIYEKLEGGEAGFDHIKISETDVRDEAKVLELNQEAKSLTVNETSREIIISGENFSYEFDRRRAMFTSLEYSGTELLDRPLEYNAFRAPTDNDCSVKRDWYKYHLTEQITKVYSLNVSAGEKGSVKIISETALGWLIFRNSFRLISEYTVFSNGSVRIKSNVKVNDKREYLPRFGLRFFLKKNFDNLEYYGYGPHESYEDKHRSTYKALFESKVCEQYEPYVRPQENGSHFGTSFVSLSDGKIKLTVTSPKDFSFNVSEYTQEELSTKAHNWELEKSGCTVFCADYKMSGVGSNSCGPYLLEKYQFNEKEFEVDFLLRVCSLS